MAASQFSVDPFLEEIYLTVLFLEDGFIVNVENYDSKGRLHCGGDIVYLEREDFEGEQLAVILGWGETEAEAESAAKVYIERLNKWHAAEPGSSRLIVLGHDVTNSQLFAEDSQTQGENEESETNDDQPLDLTTN